MRKKPWLLLIGFLALVGVAVLMGTFGTTTTKKRPGESSSAPAPSVPEAHPEPTSPWVYTSDEDTMGRKRSFAEVVSTNTLDFGFPYQGSQHGTLTIRKSARSGTEVMISIERGQFLCGVDECAVNVRFDDGPIQEFSAGEPSDHSTTVLFIEGQTRFTAHLRRAKTLRVEATFYQEGSQTLEFNVEGFSWR